MIKSFSFKSKNMHTLTQHSVDQLKNAREPTKGVSSSTVYVLSPNVKTEQKYKDKHLF